VLAPDDASAHGAGECSSNHGGVGAPAFFSSNARRVRRERSILCASFAFSVL
jgi:hypothetical protein